ncbi:hypothetical protein Bhyg_11856 [Pseudolycoriella hygida]|uniref:Uncharacterized protein n=1 Tax=Pseudolycoriella hygida TaxID=35572 RepID=A0A9Q0MYL6_9DIPT|nr:hypothetical protein Bhyg_11856 [Pseudolycoriella hygida]
MSSLLRVEDSRFKLELLDPAAWLQHSGGHAQLSEHELLFFRHLHRIVLQSVLHLQDVKSESVELIETTDDLTCKPVSGANLGLLDIHHRCHHIRL